MIEESFFLIGQIFLGIVIPSLAVFALTVFFQNRNKFHIELPFLLLFSLGFGTALNSILLYYLLLLFHFSSPIYLFLILMSIYGIIISLFFDQIKTLTFQKEFIYRHKYIVLFVTLSTIYGFFYSIKNPVIDHDYSEYALLSKVFFRNLHIDYVKHLYDPSSGFYYVGLHGYSFPLIGTWQEIVGASLGLKTDAYFKFITPYYWALLILFVYFYLNKINHTITLIGLIAFVLSKAMIYLFTTFHIDTFRIFTFLMAFYFAQLFFSQKDRFTLVLLSIACASTAFIHSISLFFVCFLMIGLFLFQEDLIKSKVKNILISALIMFVFGFIHYFLDVFYGTGWVFQDIKFY